MGVDTKSRAFHYVVGDYAYGSRVSSQEDHDLARADLFREAKTLFERKTPRHVFCEAPLALQNGKTTRLLCMAAAAVWCGFVASETDGFWYWVDPATWKREVLGGAPPRGMKHKPWIRQRSLELWPHVLAGNTLEDFDREPDFFDARCLLVYGQQVVDSL